MATPEEQMKAVFKSVRTDVDPVSGNEVPPGSLPEEVRDDLPAMLSEGEYVIPADVLRFYGMKFFEDLRTEAKMGLAEMEANGRIGGEPVSVQSGSTMKVSSRLTPEEQAEIDSMQMSAGGFVPNQTQMNTSDPYMQQQAMYRSNEPVAMGNAGYNEGGATEDADDTVTTFDAAKFMPGFSFMGKEPESSDAVEQEAVVLYGPKGEVIPLMLPSQQDEYDRLLGEGYRTELGSKQTGLNIDDVGGGPDTPAGPEPVDYSAMTDEELSEALSRAEQMSNLSKYGKVAGLPGAIIGGIIGLGARSTIAAIQEEMSSRSKTSTTTQTTITPETITEDAINSSGITVDQDTTVTNNNSLDIDRFADWEAYSSSSPVSGLTAPPAPPIDTFADWEAYSSSSPVSGLTAPSATQNAINDIAGYLSSVQASTGDRLGSGTVTSVPSDRSYDAFGNEYGSSVEASVADSVGQAAATSANISQSMGSSSSSSGSSGGAAAAATGGQGDQGLGSGWGGMNKGGLMRKKPKKKK